MAAASSPFPAIRAFTRWRNWGGGCARHAMRPCSASRVGAADNQAKFFGRFTDSPSPRPAPRRRHCRPGRQPVVYRRRQRQKDHARCAQHDHRVPRPHGRQRTGRHCDRPGRQPVVHRYGHQQDRPDHTQRACRRGAAGTPGPGTSKPSSKAHSSRRALSAEAVLQLGQVSAQQRVGDLPVAPAVLFDQTGVP